MQRRGLGEGAGSGFEKIGDVVAGERAVVEGVVESAGGGLGSGTLRLGHRLRLGRTTEWTLKSEFGDDTRTFRAGYGYRLGNVLDLNLEATRREAANDDAAEHGLMLRAGMRW